MNENIKNVKTTATREEVLALRLARRTQSRLQRELKTLRKVQAKLKSLSDDIPEQTRAVIDDCLKLIAERFPEDTPPKPESTRPKRNTIDEENKTINIAFRAHYPADVLSNLHQESREFQLDGISCHSMEGFLQSLKVADTKLQKILCLNSGQTARKSGQQYSAGWQRDQRLYWLGETYERQSEEYHRLLQKAFRARFDQSEEFRLALKATQGYTLLHTYGNDDPTKTILTTSEFLELLEELRSLL